MSVVDTIMKAAKDKKTVMITYIDAKGNTSERETEPYEIKDGRWYYGYCLIRNEIRKFDIAKISGAKLTENSYEPRWPLKF